MFCLPPPPYFWSQCDYCPPLLPTPLSSVIPFPAPGVYNYGFIGGRVPGRMSAVVSISSCSQLSVTVSVTWISVNTAAPLIGGRLNTSPPSQLDTKTFISSPLQSNRRKRAERWENVAEHLRASLFRLFAANRNRLLCNTSPEAPPLKRWYVGRQTAAVEAEAPEADYSSTVSSLYGQYNQTPTS